MKVNSLLEELRKLTTSEADPVPEGFKNYAEWGKEFGIKYGAVERLFARGIKAGLIEKRILRVHFGNSLRKCAFFRRKPRK